MIIVGVITVVIIAGAAIIFRKIKNMRSEQSPEDPKVTDLEWKTPIMSRTNLVDCSNNIWDREHKGRHFEFHTVSAHHYETPLQLQDKLSEDLLTPRYGHNGYSSQLYLGNQYVKLKPLDISNIYCTR